MRIGTVFINNKTQAVSIPTDLRLPENVNHVTIRAIGKERIIAPLEFSWDSFFINPSMVTDDFMPELTTQTQHKRDAL